MVCSVSPYFTDEELIETLRLSCPDYDSMWLLDWNHILSSIRDGGDGFLYVSILYRNGRKRKLSIDRITGGVIFVD